MTAKDISTMSRKDFFIALAVFKIYGKKLVGGGHFDHPLTVRGLRLIWMMNQKEKVSK